MPVLFTPLYRLYATAALLVIFLLFGALLIVSPGLQRRRRIARAGSRWALRASGQPLRVSGLEHLPQRACVAVANHASYLDSLVLAAALPERFTFVVQDGAARWPYVGLVIRRMGVIFVDRGARVGARQTRALLRRLKRNESLAVFAEGTFAAEPGLLPFRRGAFLIAAHAGVPMLPVAIRGTRRLLGEHQRLLRPTPVEVELLPCVPASADPGYLLKTVRGAIAARCGEPDLQPALKSDV
ncbi:MAG: 1-acyl-sn-glycerol-3-phosphate acyltransferase [Gammaproteobacteria bacterium]|nr:1-acyl-sn-glycerol-3-phosphate acyltransferase [Gammaproteobacteria bacterium]